MEGRGREGHRRPHRRMSHIHPQHKGYVVQQRSQDSTDSSSSGKKVNERKGNIFSFTCIFDPIPGFDF
jgi:hypothetical protein